MFPIRSIQANCDRVQLNERNVNVELWLAKVSNNFFRYILYSLEITLKSLC